MVILASGDPRLPVIRGRFGACTCAGTAGVWAVAMASEATAGVFGVSAATTSVWPTSIPSDVS